MNLVGNEITEGIVEAYIAEVGEEIGVVWGLIWALLKNGTGMVIWEFGGVNISGWEFVMDEDYELKDVYDNRDWLYCEVFAIGLGTLITLAWGCVNGTLL